MRARVLSLSCSETVPTAQEHLPDVPSIPNMHLNKRGIPPRAASELGYTHTREVSDPLDRFLASVIGAGATPTATAISTSGAATVNDPALATHTRCGPSRLRHLPQRPCRRRARMWRRLRCGRWSRASMRA